jgi:hypothetical protein
MRLAGTPLSLGQTLLSALRRHLTPALAADLLTLTRVESCIQQARVLLAEIAQQAQDQETAQKAQRTERLRNLEQALLATFDLKTQLDVLVRELEGLGIPGAYLSLYLDPTAPTGDARMDHGLTTKYGRISLLGRGGEFPARHFAVRQDSMRWA